MKNIQVNISTNKNIIDSNINITKKQLEGSVTKLPSMKENNYNNLENLPSINGVTLKGDKTPQDLLFKTSQIENDSEYINRTELEESIKDKVEGATLNGNEVTKENNILNIEVTKEDVGLSNVDNTSDLNKPLSTQTQEALNSIKGDLKSHIDNQNNPHNVTKSQIGLDKVDNTSDKDKPVSTAQSNAIQQVQSNLDEISTNLSEDITEINNKIPTQASSTNQLADKAFVNSSINNFAAFYITKNANGDPFESYNELITTTVYYSGGEVRIPSTNDYCFVRTDETHNNSSTRYSYQKTQWEFQYIVNETPLTAAQLAAINSGITSDLVTQITTNKNNISNLQTKIPTEYLKDASVTDNTLTIVKQDNSEITFQGGQDISGKVDKIAISPNINLYRKVNNTNKNQQYISTSKNFEYSGSIPNLLEKDQKVTVFQNELNYQVIANYACNSDGSKKYDTLIRTSSSNNCQILLRSERWDAVEGKFNSKSYAQCILHSEGSIKVLLKSENDDVTQLGIYNKKIDPYDDNSIDLGTSLSKFRDLYLAGKLSDGTNEITIANIAKKNDIPDTSSFITKDVNDLTNYTTTTNLTTLLSNKVDKSSIVQSTGDSTTNIMSQDVTTKELTAITTSLSNKFSNHAQSAYNCNTCYDEGVYLIAAGSNCPSGSQYGSLFVMPYRKPTGNTKPDFCTQIFIPNGDDPSDPNIMFYRTSLADSWNAWQKVVTTDELNKKINISGGKFTGEVKFNEVNGSCINYDTGFYINKKNGSALFGTNGTNVWVGTPDTALTMRGNATRPTYNNNTLALYNEVIRGTYDSATDTFTI